MKMNRNHDTQLTILDQPVPVCGLDWFIVLPLPADLWLWISVCQALQSGCGTLGQLEVVGGAGDLRRDHHVQVVGLN